MGQSSQKKIPQNPPIGGILSLLGATSKNPSFWRLWEKNKHQKSSVLEGFLHRFPFSSEVRGWASPSIHCNFQPGYESHKTSVNLHPLPTSLIKMTGETGIVLQVWGQWWHFQPWA